MKLVHRTWQRAHTWGFCLVLGLLGCRARATPSEPPEARPQTVPSLPSGEPSPADPAGAFVRPTEFGEGEAKFYVPARRDSNAKLPLLVLLHGLGGSGASLVRELGFPERAQRDQFVYVAPDGTLDRLNRRFWNAGPVCCNFFGAGVDDVARVERLIAFATRELPVDPRRVFLVGYSNGGYMAHRVACERSDRIAAIVSLAGAGREDCAPAHGVAVLEIHGDRDTIVPPSGGHLFGRPELPRTPDVRAGLAPWRAKNGCAGAFRVVEKADVVSDVAGDETEIERPSRCSAAPVEHWNVRGGAHVLALTPGALDRMWEFLSKQSRPER